MPQSLVRMLVHVVFSKKNRVDLITPDIENELFGYMQEIVKNNNSKLLLANGMANHVHMLVSLEKVLSISELVGDIKRDSSSRIKKQDTNFSKFY